MLKITFREHSYLKWSPCFASELPDYQKQLMPAGFSIRVAAIAHELERGHLLLTLDQSSDLTHVNGRNSVYFYPPHTDYQPLAESSPIVPTSAASYRHVGLEGLKCIQHYESCRLTPYRCSEGILTCGWGSTGPHIYEGMRMTQAEADALLKQDLVRFEHGVMQGVTVPITRLQFDALVSFSFNCGVRGFLDSTLLRKLNNQDFAGAAAEFGLWTNRGLPGLVARRESERRMFCGEPFQPMN